MNSDRLLIFGIPALVAVLVHLLFVFALEGGWTTASPTVTAQPPVVQASLVSLSQPKPKPKPEGGRRDARNREDHPSHLAGGDLEEEAAAEVSGGPGGGKAEGKGKSKDKPGKAAANR